MTSKNSICFKCAYLVSYSEGVLTFNGERYLGSYCSRGGGRNVGNRKTCRRFVQATDEIIAKREKTLNGGIK